MLLELKKDLINNILFSVIMSTIIPFGDTFVDEYPRYTQFILNYRLGSTTIIDVNNNDFLKYNVSDENSIILSRKYNKYKASSFVFHSDINSFNHESGEFLHMMLHLFTCIGNRLNGKDVLKQIIFEYDVDFLGVIEHTTVKGWHLHFLIFYRECYETEKEYDTIQSAIFNKLHDLTLNTESGNKIFINVQKVKSIGSMINYIKKEPYYLLGSTTEICQMFVHFNRFHIFAPNTTPKLTNLKSHKTSEDAIVEFFLRKLKEGCIDLQQALQDPYAENILANPRLSEIWNNTTLHFLANRTFKDAVEEIIDKVLTHDKWYKKCICPIIEYLKLQQIDIYTFEQKFVKWLKCNSKKNSILFIGPADTGKSVFLSTLHSNFRFAHRLTQDGIFTYAGAVNADCVYHEEPFIEPVTADTAKLVYEGNPSTTVAVKNRPQTRLNKKIPVLISSNFPLYKYVSGQRAAFEARVHEFNPTYKISNYHFCDDNKNFTHTCSPLNIDIKRRSYKCLHGTCSDEDLRIIVSQEDNDEENLIQGNSSLNDCKSVHKLHKNHWRAFIYYCILKYKLQEYYFYIDNRIDIPNIFDPEFKHLPFPIPLPLHETESIYDNIHNTTELYNYIGYKNILSYSGFSCYQLQL